MRTRDVELVPLEVQLAQPDVHVGGATERASRRSLAAPDAPLVRVHARRGGARA